MRVRTKFYDRRGNRLEFYGSEATPQFWDRHWLSDLKWPSASQPERHWIVKQVKRYLPRGSRILEGGCGTGRVVQALQLSGYAALGIDSAKETVKQVQKRLPQLDVRCGDVRQLGFGDECFDGYVSIGVIEHFKEGFADVAVEMKRVIRKGGYLFLSFPYLSPLRRLKIGLGAYSGQKSDLDFYQYALSAEKVIQEFQGNGFSLVDREPIDGLKGFKDEVLLFRSVLQALYSYRGSSIVVRGARYLLTAMLTPFCGHSILIVFKRS